MRTLALALAISFFYWCISPDIALALTSEEQQKEQQKNEGMFLPDYLVQQQQAHESLMKTKDGLAALGGSLEEQFGSRLRRKNSLSLLMEDSQRKGRGGVENTDPGAGGASSTFDMAALEQMLAAQQAPEPPTEPLSILQTAGKNMPVTNLGEGTLNGLNFKRAEIVFENTKMTVAKTASVLDAAGNPLSLKKLKDLWRSNKAQNVVTTIEVTAERKKGKWIVQKIQIVSAETIAARASAEADAAAAQAALDAQAAADAAAAALAAQQAADAAAQALLDAQAAADAQALLDAQAAADAAAAALAAQQAADALAAQQAADASAQALLDAKAAADAQALLDAQAAADAAATALAAQQAADALAAQQAADALAAQQAADALAAQQAADAAAQALLDAQAAADAQAAEETLIMAASAFTLDANSIEDFSYPAGTLITSLPPGYATSPIGSWLIQNNNAFDPGGFAIQSGAVAGGGTSVIVKTVNLLASASLSFKWSIDSNATDSLKLFIDGVQISGVLISGSSGWASVANVALSSGLHTIQWVYDRTGTAPTGPQKNAAWVDNVLLVYDDIVRSFSYPPGTALPLSSSYTTSAAGGWVDQNTTAFETGGFAAQAGATAAGGTSYLERTFTAVGGGTLNFNWNIDAAPTDKIKLFMDGVEVTGIFVSGISGWQPVNNIVLQPGVHTVRWVFDRTGTAPAQPGSSKAWVDNINLVYDEVLHTAALPPGTVLALPTSLTTSSILAAPAPYTTSAQGAWVDQNITAFDAGGFALQAGSTAVGSSSYVQRQVTLTAQAALSFRWSINSDSTDKLKLLIDGVDAPGILISGNSNGFVLVSNVLVPAGTHTIKIVYDRTATSGGNPKNGAWVDEMKMNYAGLGESFSYAAGTVLGLPAGYATSATGAWVDQNTTAADSGGFSIQSGATAAGSSSYVERQVNLLFSANLSFQWAVNSDSTDKLKLLIDGVPVSNIQITGNSNGFVQVSNVAVSAGSHTFRIVYDRTGTASGPAKNAAWVDNLKITYPDATNSFSTSYPVPDSGRWAPTGDGTTVQQVVSATNASPAKFLMNGSSLQYGTIETRVKFTGTQTWNSEEALIYYGMADANNGYAVKFTVYNWSYRVDLYKVINGSLSLLAGGATYSITNTLSLTGGLGEWWGFKVELTSIQTRVYLNLPGYPYAEIFSAEGLGTPPTGKVGIGNTYLSAPAIFDTVKTTVGATVTPYNLSTILLNTPRLTAMPTTGNWQIQSDGGNQAYSQSKIYSGYDLALLNNASLQDGTLEAKVKITGTSASDQALIHFRMSVDGKYGYCVKTDKNGTLTLSRVDNGNYIQLASFNLLSVAGYNVLAYHTIKIEMDGGLIKVSVDGAERISKIDTTYYGALYTHAILGTYYTSAPVWFDDVSALNNTYSKSDFSAIPSYPNTPASGYWVPAGDGTSAQQQHTGWGAFSDASPSKFLMNGSSYLNGATEFKVKFDGALGPPNPSDVREALVYFQMTDPNNGYAVKLRLQQGTSTNISTLYVSFQRVVNGSLTALGPEVFAMTVGGNGLGDLGGNWYKVKINYTSPNGGTTSVFVAEGAAGYSAALLSLEHGVLGQSTAGGLVGVGNSNSTGSISFGTITTPVGNFNPGTVLSNLAPLTPLPDTGKWAVADDGAGNFAYSQSRTNYWGYDLARLQNASYQNGPLEVRVRIDGTANSDEALIHFRMSADGKYGYCVKTDRYKNLILSRVDNGNYIQIASFNLSAIAGYNPAQYHLFKIQLSGSSIKVLVDGTERISAADSTYSGAAYDDVMLGTYATSGAVWFDDISIGKENVFSDNFTQTPALGTGSAWLIQNTTAADPGGFAAQAGSTPAGFSSPIQKTVTSALGGTLGFDWKIASSAADSLKLLVDGAAVPGITVTANSNGWVHVGGVAIGAGTHTLQWVYDRTGTLTGPALNGAWVDNITVNYNDLIQNFAQPSTSPAPSNGRWVANADGTVTQALAQTLLGTSAYNDQAPAKFIFSENSPLDGTIETQIKFGGTSSQTEERGLIYAGGHAVMLRYSAGHLWVYLFRVEADGTLVQEGLNRTPPIWLYVDTGIANVTDWQKVKIILNGDNINIFLDKGGDASPEGYQLVLDASLRAIAQVFYDPNYEWHWGGGPVGIGNSVLNNPITFGAVTVTPFETTPTVTTYNPAAMLQGIERFTPMPQTGDWRYVNDGTGNIAYVQARTNFIGYDLSTLNNANIENGTIVAKVKIEGTTSDDKALIHFRMSADGLRGYCVTLDRSGVLTLSSLLGNGLYTKITDFNLGSAVGGFSAAQFHEIKIALEGRSITVFVDGISRITTISDTYSGANYTNVVLGTYHTSGLVRFDDVAIDTPATYSENFTRTASYTNAFTPVSGSWSTADDGSGNEAYRQIQTGSTGHDLSVAQGMVIADGEVSADVKLTGTGADERALLYFRMSADMKNGYAAAVQLSDNSLSLYKIVNGVYSKLGSFALTGISGYNFAEYHNLRVSLDGSLIEVFLDGTPRLSATDSSYQGAGYTGVALGTRNISAPAWFDNLASRQGPLIDTFSTDTGHSFVPTGKNWIGLDDGTGNIAYTQMHIGNLGYDLAVLGNAAFQDGTIETKIKIDGPIKIGGTTAVDRALVYFRMSADMKNGYAVALDWQKTLALYKVTNGTYVLIRPLGQTALTVNLGTAFNAAQYHSVKVDLSGSWIRVYVDGALKITVSDSTYRAPQFTGIAIGTYNTSGLVRFDDFSTKGGVQNKETFTQIMTYPDAPASGLWTTAADGYVQQAYAGWGVFSDIKPARFLMQGSSLANGSVETRMKFTGTVPSLSEEGLVYFRMQDAATGYAAKMILVNGWAYLQLYRVANGSLTAIGPKAGVGAAAFGQWHKIRIELSGNNIKVYAALNDGAYPTGPQIDFTDGSASAITAAGMTGIGNSSVSAPVSFDNITTDDGSGSTVYYPGSVLTGLGSLTPLPVTGNWSLADDGTGNVAYTQTRTAWPDYDISVVNNAALRDGVLSASIKMEGISGSTEKTYMYFRMSSDLRSGFALMTDTKKNVYLYKITNGSYGSPIASFNLGTITGYDTSQYHDFRVDLNGGSIIISVDGIQRIDVTNTSYLDANHTDVALGTFYLTAPVWFDDLLVQATI